MNELEKIILLENITRERIEELTGKYSDPGCNQIERFKFYFIRDLLAINMVLNERANRILNDERTNQITH